MKTLFVLCAIGLTTMQPSEAGEFRNLNFDEGIIPSSPVDPFQPADLVLPGWTARMGDHVLSEIIWGGQLSQNGTVTVEPRFGRPETFEGRYGALLAGGAEYPSLAPVLSASISQVGLIPGNAHSLLFRGVISSPTEVRIAGQVVPYEFLEVIEQDLGGIGTVSTTLWGVDVSQWAGQEVELSFINYARPDGAGFFAFDSLRFSDQVIIPEPATWPCWAWA